MRSVLYLESDGHKRRRPQSHENIRKGMRCDHNTPFLFAGSVEELMRWRKPPRTSGSGLSSTNLGEQCKAIAEFPTLILKYPFPMVINSIFLKISELFREGIRRCSKKTPSTYIEQRSCCQGINVKLRSCLGRLVESYNVSNFVKAAFKTLTSLTVRVPIHTGEQVDYILQFLRKETRLDVKLSLLSDLSQIAGCLPNQWTTSQVHRLCNLFGASSCISEKEEIFAIFFKLTESCNFVDLLLHPGETSTDDGSPGCVASCVQWAALEYTQSSDHSNSALVSRALSLACKLAVLIHLRGGDRNLASGRNSIFQSDSVSDFIAQTMSSRKAVKEEDQDFQDSEHWFLSTAGPPLMELKHMYVNLLRFFRVFPQFAVVLRSVGLFEEVVLSSNPRVALLCQFLGPLCESLVHSQKEDWLPTVSDIIEHFDATPRGAGINCESTAPALASTLPAPFVLVFRMARGEPLSVDQRLRLLSCLARATARTEDEEKCLEPWLAYKLACRASLHRQPALAADIYDQLCSLATTGRSVYWLQGLATLSRGEVNLLTSVAELSTALKTSPTLPWLPRLSSALHEASATVFKARTFFLSVGDRAVNWFQTDYLETRAAFLACLSELCLLLFHAGSSGRCARWARLEAMKSPYTASSASTLPTKNPLIVMQTLLPAWDSLLANLDALIQRCIDADLETLRHLKTFHEMVRFFRSTLSELSDSSSSDNAVAMTSPWMSKSIGANLDCLDETDGPGSDSLQILLSQFQTEFANRLSRPSSSTPAQLLANFTFQVSTCPACLPRFFFKRLQSTSIRLVILPKPNSPSEPLVLAQEMGLVLNVMGIVAQKSPRVDLVRRVTSAELVMTISRSAPSSTSSEDSSLCNFQQTQRRVVPIQREYFHTEFCLTFPRPASQPLGSAGGGSRSSTTSSTAELYRVFLEAFLLDANGLRWRLCGTSSEAGVGESILVRVEPRSSAPSVDFTQPISSQNAALLKYEVAGDSKPKVSCAT